MSSPDKEEKRQDLAGELDKAEKVIQDTDISAQSGSEGVLLNDRLRMNPSSNEVRVNNRLVTLTSTEYSLLRRLATSGGKVVSYEELLTGVRGNALIEAVPLLRMHVQHLRQKLGYGTVSPGMITDEPGIGYRFVGHLEEVW